MKHPVITKYITDITNNNIINNKRINKNIASLLISTIEINYLGLITNTKLRETKNKLL